MNLDRWVSFSKREQVLFIGSEFERARVWQEAGDDQNAKSALERAMQFIDLSFQDVRWRNEFLKLLVLRNEVASHYIEEPLQNVSRLYQVL